MKKLDWFVAEEIPRTHFHLLEPVYEYWGKEMKKDIGMIIDVLSVYRNGNVFFCWPRKQFSSAGKKTFEKTLKNPEWMIKINFLLEKTAGKLIESSKKMEKKDFSVMTNKELEKVFSSHMKIHFKCHALGMLATMIEWDHELISNYLKNYLSQRISEKKLSLKVAETFSLLTTPLDESFQLKHEKEIIRIALNVLNDEKTKKLFLENEPCKIIELLPLTNKKIGEELEANYRNFRWLPFMYIGPAWEKDYFIQQIKGLIKSGENLSLILEKMDNRINEVKRKQIELTEKLSVDEKHNKLFGISRQMIYLKGLRKDSLYYSFFSYEPFLKELGRRLGLSLNQLRCMWPSEFKKAILKRDFDSNELNERFKFSVYACVDGKSKTLTGKKAEAYARQAPDPKEYKISELEGSTAVPGMVKGTAKIINLPEDMNKMNQGDVLVSHATNPNLVPAMKKASAIITDIGGVTCHAAIVSRELNIPCVIGTKIATKVIKDGDLLDVNANHGIIKILKKEVKK
ncbi:MAG: PEP-utilizing enzyme [archaeon]